MSTHNFSGATGTNQVVGTQTINKTNTGNMINIKGNNVKGNLTQNLHGNLPITRDENISPPAADRAAEKTSIEYKDEQNATAAQADIKANNHNFNAAKGENQVVGTQHVTTNNNGTMINATGNSIGRGMSLSVGPSNIKESMSALQKENDELKAQNKKLKEDYKEICIKFQNVLRIMSEMKPLD